MVARVLAFARHPGQGALGGVKIAFVLVYAGRQQGRLLGIGCASVAIFHVGHDTLKLGHITGYSGALDFVIHHSSLRGLVALPVLVTVPCRHGTKNGYQNPGNHVAITLPEMLEFGELFLLFEVQMFCHGSCSLLPG